jgi:hypothetical protein
MPDDIANADQTQPQGTWMSDVQRVLALMLVGAFTLVLLIFAFRLVIWGDAPTLVDLIKTLISALINVVMLVLGYFYGSSKAKEQSDSSQQRVVEKLTSPPGSPAAPVPPAPTVIVAWWSLLTEAERAAITADAPNDPRVAAFAVAAGLGKATADDLAYLVARSLLTQDRATAIQAA